MANKTSIEWTATYNDDGTVTPGFNWNFLRGCSRVSDGCTRCYAEGVAARFSKPGQPYEGLAKFVDHKPRWTGEVAFIEDVLTQPLRWKKPRKIFVNSMSDLFHEKVTDDILDKAFAVMALTPQHTYQILTKRPERMRDYVTQISNYNGSLSQFWLGDAIQNLAPYVSFQALRDARIDKPLPNVWLGVSVEDQKTADERIPLLLETPAAVRWPSIEPLLGPVDLMNVQVPRDQDQLRRPWDFEGYKFDCLFENDEERFHQPPSTIDWVVVGGESGPNARPMKLEWLLSLVEQCRAAGVPVFVKQLGAYPIDTNHLRFFTKNKKGGDITEWPEDLRIREFPNV